MARAKITERSDSTARLEAYDLNLGDLRKFVKATEGWPDRVRVESHCTPGAAYRGHIEAVWTRSRSERKA